MKIRLIGLLAFGHLVTDINQGAIPALLPFLISAHGLSYTAAAGIVFAATVSSTIVQPIFGHAADRFSKPWLLPAGVLVAGIGIALIGVMGSYAGILCAAAVSGIGIAAYHPEGARLVNAVASKNTATAMSVFGVGGTLGFAIGPVLATAALLYWGLKGSLILLLPVGVTAVILAVHLNAFTGPAKSKTDKKPMPSGGPAKDAWGPFGRLSMTVIVRSILFFGLNTFVPLYWVNVLKQSKAAGGTALTVMAAAGVIGNLIGGRLSDRFGPQRVILAAFCIFTFLLPVLLWVKNPYLALGVLAPIGAMLSAPYSAMIVMGQRYLPNHVGFSAGITLGLAITVGGIATPVLGRIADLYGIGSALAAIVFLPLLAVGFALTLPPPPSAMPIQHSK